MCARYGLTITEHDFYGFAGLPLDEMVRRLHNKQKVTCTAARWAREWMIMIKASVFKQTAKSKIN